MTLTVDDFDAFHAEVHGGRSPFTWQTRLLRQIVERRRWPALLDLPTGSGKTTCIDIALFALALDQQQGIEQRWCPRRIVMIVDRRVVVDQAAERGRALLAALTRPGAGPIVSAVADRLRALGGTDGAPLGVFALRGGVPKDDSWARSPVQPLVIASTVDQVGSRLLIQGYGVTHAMRPIHAGLLGNDVLMLLDEVHLSRPFADTLDQLGNLRPRFERTSPLPHRSRHVFLSATPGRDQEDVFRLLPEERRPESQLGPRLHASKPARLEEVPGRPALVIACVTEAEAMIRRHDVIAVIVNRVGTASEIADRLEKVEGRDYEVVLLTGRMRPLDRDDVVGELRPRVLADRDRQAVERKLIVVGTQSLEAGADFDFDALVTEVAGIDALRQRFGRVDRLGMYRKSEAVIVADRTAKDDPVYAGAIPAMRAWIKGKLDRRRKVLDFGVEALPEPTPEELEELRTPPTEAPVLMPAYLDLWMQTSPPPALVPDVGLWLHGPDSSPADVQVIWRIDVKYSDLGRARRDKVALTRLIEIVGAIRPSSLESMPLPFLTARRWLADLDAPDFADVEGWAPDEADEAMTGLALRWNGTESEIIDPAALRPGDTVVVPASKGGIRNRCFDATSEDPVLDVAERASFLGRGRPALRLHPEVLKQLGLDLRTEDDVADVRSTLSVLADAQPVVRWKSEWLRRLAAGGARSIVVDAAEPWLVLQGRRLSAAAIRRLAERTTDSIEEGIEETSDPEDSPHVGNPVPLATHTRDVERFVFTFAQALGLPAWLVNDLVLAASLHDLGKADRRCQIMLRGGSELEWFKDQTLLAKSGMPRTAKSEHRLAQQRSGYPRGTRHEVQSTTLAVSADVLATHAQDWDLVLHLIASHHGYCRPFAHPVFDPDDVAVTPGDQDLGPLGVVSLGPVSSRHGLDSPSSGMAERFWTLVEKYGWHGLCWLEAVFRLADHRASEFEESGGDE